MSMQSIKPTKNFHFRCEPTKKKKKKEGEQEELPLQLTHKMLLHKIKKLTTTQAAASQMKV